MPAYLVQALSLLNSGALVVVDKQLMSAYRFAFPSALALFHFVATWIALSVLVSFKVIDPPPPVPAIARWSIGFLSAISAVSAALSLLMNSIPFYQLATYLTIPCGMAHRYLAQRPSAPVNTLMPLAFFLAGLLLFALNDSQFTLTGAFCAAIAAVLTTICQAHVGEAARQLSLTTAQVNAVACLPRAVFALVSVVASEAGALLKHEFQRAEIALGASSGLLAVAVECFSLRTGRASSLAALVADNLRTIGVIGAGLALSPGPGQAAEKGWWAMFGVCVAVGGIVAYSVANRQNIEMENRAKAALREEEEQVEAPVALIVPGVEFARADADHDD